MSTTTRRADLLRQRRAEVKRANVGCCLLQCLQGLCTGCGSCSTIAATRCRWLGKQLRAHVAEMFCCKTVSRVSRQQASLRNHYVSLTCFTIRTLYSVRILKIAITSSHSTVCQRGFRTHEGPHGLMQGLRTRELQPAAAFATGNCWAYLQPVSIRETHKCRSRITELLNYLIAELLNC